MNIDRSPREVLALLTRRRFQILAVVLAGLLVASSAAIVRPQKYQSQTRLRIEGVGGLDGDDWAERIQNVTKDILNDASFDRVVSALNLDEDYRDLPEAERAQAIRPLLTELQARTQVTYERAAAATYVVTIAHVSGDPETCYQLVSQLASTYQTDTFSRPVEQQKRVVEQHREEQERAQAELEKKSGELERFEQENAEFLEGPEQRLADVRDEIEQVEKVDIGHHQEEIAKYDSYLESEPEELIHYEEVVDQTRLTELEKQIRDKEAELTKLRVEGRKTDHHPQVVALLEILERLGDEKKELEAQKVTRPVRRANPMYKSLRDAKLKEESLLGLAKRKLSVLRRKEQELLEEVHHAPEIRAARDSMRHEVKVARARYEERKTAFAKATDALEALTGQRQLKFETMDPPTRPSGTSGPGVLVIALLGLAAGAGAGVGLAYVLDTMDQSFRDVEQVSKVLGVPTLGAIHLIQTDAELAEQRGRDRRKVFGLGLLGAAALGVLAFAYLGDVSGLQELIKGLVR